MLCLIEGVEINLILNNFLENIDYSTIRNYLKNQYIKFLKFDLKIHIYTPLKTVIQKLKKVKFFTESFLESFNLYIFIASISVKNNEPLKNLYSNINSDEVEKNALKFFRFFTGKIEINFKNQLHSIFFPIHPSCLNLSKITKSKFMKSVKRETPQDKILVNLFKKKITILLIL